jgi:hypothetical protein
MHARFRKVLALLVTGVLVIHVVIILFLTFSPSPERAGNSMVARAYQHFIHIGPFFREDAIQASQHVVAGYFKQGEWNYIDLTDSLVHRYQNNPWKTQELSVRDRIRENARSLVGRKGWRESGEFRNLHHYARSRHPEIRESDSVSIIFVIRWYKPELKRHIPDTLFHLTFDPADEE